jgi:hypothetical protein
MKLVRWRNLFESPSAIRQEEGRCSRHSRELVVVDNNDSRRANQTAEVGEIKKDAVEAVVAVHEREIEPSSLSEEAWEGRL